MAPPLDDPVAVAAWLAERLEADGIAYAIGGALALGAHGIPRMTDDVDLAVFAPEAELDRLFDAVERAGCLFDRARASAKELLDGLHELQLIGGQGVEQR